MYINVRTYIRQKKSPLRTYELWQIIFTNQQTNTFQGIIITDGVHSYSLFTYKCGDMEWSRGGIIGFNAAGELYANHPLSQSQESNGAPLIACSNSDISQWTNVVYNLSVANPTGTDAPPTVEPRELNYVRTLDEIKTPRLYN